MEKLDGDKEHKGFYVLKIIHKHRKQIEDFINILFRNNSFEGKIMDYTHTGYLFLDMDYNKTILQKIIDLEGCIEFIGKQKPVRAFAASKSEQVKEAPSFKEGSTVLIKKGIFKNYNGIVEQIIDNKFALVNVMFLGRMTPLKVSIRDIEI